jgi:hypothetical protein
MLPSRLTVIAATLVASVAAAPVAMADGGGLVRIEPRPYYGAVVTVEKGVRVYRALPSQHLMVINPNNAPVNITYNRTIDNRTVESGGTAPVESGLNDYGPRLGIGSYGNGFGNGFGFGQGPRRNASGGVGAFSNVGPRATYVQRIAPHQARVLRPSGRLASVARVHVRKAPARH